MVVIDRRSSSFIIWRANPRVFSWGLHISTYVLVRTAETVWYRYRRCCIRRHCFLCPVSCQDEKAEEIASYGLRRA